MTVSRRTVLGALGAGLATLSGCTEAIRADLGSREVSESTGPLAPPSTVQPAGSSKGWSGLRDALEGRLVLPADSGYAAAKRAFNPQFDTRKPAAIAQVASASDVQRCVEHARSADVPVAARSGGHSYPGYSTPARGLIIDLGRLRHVTVRDDGTAVIGAGARLGDVYAALAARGRCLPAGSCPTVGISGLTLGGGIGVLSRQYGLTCDQLVSARVVTADGTYRSVSDQRHADLFWALRGGGGGNFGVVTHFTFHTVAAPRVTIFSLRFPPGSTPAVLGAWQEWVRSAPNQLWSNLVVTSGSPPSCRVGGTFVGGAGPLQTLLDRLVRAAGAMPSTRVVGEKSYLEAMRYFAGTATRERFFGTSRIMQRPLADPAQLVDPVDGQPGVVLIVDALGGKVAAHQPSDTAFPHRSALATVQIYTQTHADTARAVRDELGAVLGGHGYVNYLDRTMPSWGKAYYGRNLPRLRTVGQRYDPDGVFDFAQNVSRA